MAQVLRETINGTTPQDIMKINNNTENIWFKIYGNLDFDDTNTQTQEKIQTQWIPFQGEGNMDKNYPLYIRFFAPPNIKKIKSSTLNAICERYRMDSGVARGGGGVENVEIVMSMGSSNVAISSVSSPIVGTSSYSSERANISTRLDGISTSKYVDMWGAPNMEKIYPTNVTMDYYNNPPNEGLNYVTHSYTNSYYSMTYGSSITNLAPLVRGLNMGVCGWYLDMALVQHQHDISHTHNFTLTQDPHSHSFTLKPHSHDIALEPHTHTATGKINLEPHEHELNEGIKISSVSPQNVNVYVNNTKVTTLSENNATANNIDIANYVKIGEWNTIKIETTSLARCTIYGTLEAIMKR